MKGVSEFMPNDLIHRDFADTLKKAQKYGVEVICVDCIVKPDEIIPDKYVPFRI